MMKYIRNIMLCLSFAAMGFVAALGDASEHALEPRAILLERLNKICHEAPADWREKLNELRQEYDPNDSESNRLISNTQSWLELQQEPIRITRPSVFQRMSNYLPVVVDSDHFRNCLIGHSLGAISVYNPYGTEYIALNAVSVLAYIYLLYGHILDSQGIGFQIDNTALVSFLALVLSFLCSLVIEHRDGFSCDF